MTTTIHLAIPRSRSGKLVDEPVCAHGRTDYQMTRDRSEVTCSRCRKMALDRMSFRVREPHVVLEELGEAEEKTLLRLCYGDEVVDVVRTGNGGRVIGIRNTIRKRLGVRATMRRTDRGVVWSVDQPGLFREDIPQQLTHV